MSQKKTRQQTASVCPETNKHLCNFLLSAAKTFGLKSYKKSFSPPLAFKESTDRISNRLKYLKKIQLNNPTRFFAVCEEFGVSSSLPQVDTSFDSDDTSSGAETDGEEDCISLEEEEAQRPPPPLTNLQPTTLQPTTMTTSMATTTTRKNMVGKVIMCRPSDESFFTLFWVDQNLDKAVSQVILQSRRAILRSKKPTLGESTKEDSAAILDNMGYGFARDPNNTTVAALAKSLMEIKQRMEYDRDDGWSEEIICEYPEEVLTHFVDENGKPSKVKYDKDEFGRQCIGFFAKPVRSSDKPAPAIFETRAKRHGRNDRERSRRSSRDRSRRSSRSSRRSSRSSYRSHSDDDSYDSRDGSHYMTPRDDDERSYMEMTVDENTPPVTEVPTDQVDREEVDTKLNTLLGFFRERTTEMEENRNQETAEMKSSIMELGDMIGKMATAITNTNTVPLGPIFPDRVSS
jgi:hypothetical protein